MSVMTEDQGILKILQSVQKVAVVGCSPNTGAKNYVPHFMITEGYTIFPVNPRYANQEVLGRTCYATLKDLPEKVDMVQCFRPSKDILPIAKDAIEIGAKVLWMQAGIINEEAAKLASEAGLDVVMDRCPCAEIPRLVPGKEKNWKDYKAKYKPIIDDE